MEKTYNFKTQLLQGQDGEWFLDQYFKGKFNIFPANEQQQRHGIDRIFIERGKKRVLFVEYKTDITAATSHNAFVETISVDSMNKPGWAFTSQADMLLYYIPGDGIIYVLRFDVLRSQLPRWEKVYPVRKIPNEGYYTHGLIVPLDEFERYSEARICV